MRRFLPMFWLSALGLALSAVSLADDQDRVRELSRSGAIVPLEQITAQVRERNIAHILEVELESRRDRLYYEVEGLDDAGMVHELKFDATTGMMIDGPHRK